MMQEKFREVRVIKRVTQEDLERKTHISQTRISLIENGLSKPTEADKAKLARALGTSVQRIFPTKSRKPKRNNEDGSILTGAVNEN